MLDKDGQGKHIAISGLIGAGKTTLIRKLSSAFDYVGLEERFEDNPYLANFYRDPPAWALKSYMFFFQRTLEDHIAAQSLDGDTLQERTLDEHLLVFGEEYYARGYLTGADIDLLRSLTASVTSQLTTPDLLVHIDINPIDALSRLRQRANPIEAPIDIEYLVALDTRYENMLSKWKGTVLRIDGTRNIHRDHSFVSDTARNIREALDRDTSP